jgi:hypothetical protein
MKPIVYSRHARGRMRLYDISRQDVVQVLEKPDREETTILGRMNVFREVNGKRLRVTYVEEEGRIVIVTTTPLA